jgi:hypothetical protein
MCQESPALTASNTMQGQVGGQVSIPRLVIYTGNTRDLVGHSKPGVNGMTFSLYEESSGSAPQWMETQNVTVDRQGNYSIVLGITKPDGVPVELLSSGLARWLGIRLENNVESPRIVFTSVPFAFHASSADSLANHAATEYVLAQQLQTSSGLDQLGLTSLISASIASQLDKNGNQYARLDAPNRLSGDQMVDGTLSLDATGTATTAGGFASFPVDLLASSFNSATAQPETKVFRWQVAPVRSNTTSPSASLNLLYGASASATPTLTGLSINEDGTINFAPRQPLFQFLVADKFASIQDAITAAGQSGAVFIPPTYTGTGVFTNPNNIPVIDLRGSGNVRNAGVTCDGTTDDTAAIQAVFDNATNFSTVVIPSACRIGITRTVTVSKKQGLHVIFMQGSDPANQSSAAGFYWRGACNAGGDMLYLNQMHGGEWDNLQLYVSGSGTTCWGANKGPNRALVIGELAPVGQISTAIQFNAGYIQNQVQNDSFVGVEIGDTAPGNVENMHFDHFTVECSLATPGNQSSIGFDINGATAQPDNIIIEGAGPTGCGKGVYVHGNSKMDMFRNWTGGGNYTDFYFGASSGGGITNLTIDSVRSENSIQPIYIGCNQSEITLRNVQLVATGATSIIVPTGVGGTLVLDGVYFDARHPALSLDLTLGNSMHIVERGSAHADATFLANLEKAVQLDSDTFNIHQSTAPFIFVQVAKYPGFTPSPVVTLRGVVNSGTSFDDFNLLNVGALNTGPTLTLTHTGNAGTPVFAIGAAQSGVNNVQVATPRLDNILSANPGSTTYTYVVAAHGSTGVTPCSASLSTTTGNATLNSTNFNVVNFRPAYGAVSYDIYRTAGGATLGKIGTLLPTSGQPNVQQFRDTGQAGDGSSCPVSNTTGSVNVPAAACYQKNGACLTASDVGALPSSTPLAQTKSCNGTDKVRAYDAATGQFTCSADQTAGVTSVAGRTGDVVLTKFDVGLGNVENTSDANKPISTATQAALNTKLDKGTATWPSSGTVTTTVASGTATLAAAPIAAKSCAEAATVAASGVATTDVILWTPIADLTAVSGYMPGDTLKIYSYPATNTINFKVCNTDTTNAVIPGVVTLNWRVVR